MANARVVIVGGGFGGLRCAQGLADAPVAVTLIDRRNHHVFQPQTPVKIRANFYAEVFRYVIESHKSDVPIAGVNFWAWGGEGKPAHAQWLPGDAFIGDPPHEAQGWYSVYASDKTTLSVIAEYARQLAVVAR